VAEVLSSLGLELLCPITRGERLIACLGLGARAAGGAFGPDERAFLRSMAACASTSIENGLMYEELRRVNQRLATKVFQLNGLFDISRELTASLDEEAIQGLVATTLLGQLMASRCVLYLGGVADLRLVHERGVRTGPEMAVPPTDASLVLRDLRGPVPVIRLPACSFRDRLVAQRLSLAVPLLAGAEPLGLAAVGERASGAPFTDEDLDFAQALARQASSALLTVRLHRVRLEKERQDRELTIARGIQEGLFPAHCPVWPGLQVAAQSRPCQQVGGDYYDFIPIGDDRWAVAIADVSGKGTPASILMASVHASLRALAGTASPAATLSRLNRFLFENTQPNRFCTLFYGEIDVRTRQLRYVSAGHVPPYLQRANGVADRLAMGGPALGLLEEAEFEEGAVTLEAGDTLAVVTDGATEALSPGDDEFGDERVAAVLRGPVMSASDRVSALVDAIHAWTGPAGCSDDLTVLVMTAL
jgi:sigma-B regulation protein RsbU (phosphoserine phosphatase)